MVWKSKDASSDESSWPHGLIIHLALAEGLSEGFQRESAATTQMKCECIHRWGHGEWGGQDTDEPWGKRKPPNFRHRVLEYVRPSHLGAAGVGAA